METAPTKKDNLAYLNPAQLINFLIAANEAYNILPRGGGKTQGILAPSSKRNMEQMPRSLGLSVSATFQQALTQTLPSRISGWERLGWIKDRHYFVGRRGPRSWPEPFEPPLNYEKCIHCYTGSAIQLVSQDVRGSIVGRNSDWIDGDEVKFLDYPRFLEEVLPTMRANKGRFGHIPWHWGINFVTTMPTAAESKWIFNKEKEMDPDVLKLLKALISKQLQLKVQLAREDISKSKKIQLSRNVNTIEAEMNILRKNFVFFYEPRGIQNVHVLSPDYIRRMRRSMLDFIFNTEILNIRPDTVEAGFYALFDPMIHCYGDSFNNDYLQGLEYNMDALRKRTCLMDRDCNALLPLRIAVDWGGNISCLTVGQEEGSQYRLINNFYVKHPELTSELAKAFTDYYSSHLTREIIFIKDRRWGDSRRPDKDTTINEDFILKLEREGWRVTIVNTPLRIAHGDIYLYWQRIFSHKEPQLPRFSFNKYNCKELITSIMLTPIKETDKGLQKDKKSERNDSINQEDATHFSDTLDLHLLSKSSVLKLSQPEFIAPFVI